MAIQHIEWRAYDTNELTVICDEHVGEIVVFEEEFDLTAYRTCSACFKNPRHAATCEVDITEVYRNLLKNLSIVIALAAAAQRERMSDDQCSLSR